MSGGFGSQPTICAAPSVSVVVSPALIQKRSAYASFSDAPRPAASTIVRALHPSEPGWCLARVGTSGTSCVVPYQYVRCFAVGSPSVKNCQVGLFVTSSGTTTVIVTSPPGPSGETVRPSAVETESALVEHAAAPARR